MSTQDFTVYENGGALPGLDSEVQESEVLGVPGTSKRSTSNVKKLLILGMILLAFLFILAGLLIWQKNRTPVSNNIAEAKPASVVPTYTEKNLLVHSGSIAQKKQELKEQEEREREAQAKAEAEAEAAMQQMRQQQQQQAQERQQHAQERQQQAQTGQQQHQTGTQGLEPSPRDRKLSGGVLLGSNGAKLAPGQEPTEKDLQEREVQARMAKAGVSNSSQPSGLFNQAQAPQNSNPDSLSGRLQPSVMQARKAGKLPNLDYLLKKGTSIPCVLKTGIDTTLPGFVTCIAQNDIYSANGKMLLVERGASIFGEQQSALKQGQTRTFVVWSRIDNPSGVYADIDSPATDQMGYSGIPGYVETYFWQRFGGAIMLSLIKDFSSAYSNKMSGNNGNGTNQNNYGNTQQATQDMASEALRNSINIPPTLLVLPGKVINVLVARDVSFESVYAFDE